MTVGSVPKRENASKSNSTADMTGKLSLPPEWGQSVNPDAGASKEDSTDSHDASATSIGQDFGSTEETKQKMPKQHAKVATGVTPIQYDDARMAGTSEEEEEAKRAKQAQPDTTNASKYQKFKEEEQPEVKQPEDSPGWGLQELYEEHKTERDLPSERMPDVEMEVVGSDNAEGVSATLKTQPQHRVDRKEGGRGRSPTTRSKRMDKTKKDLRADFKKNSQDAAQRLSTRVRKVSLSPKRKAAAHWTADRNHDMLDELMGTSQIPRQHRTARSLSPKMRAVSPKRRTTEVSRKGKKTARQQFIHQYMQATSGNTNGGDEDNSREQKTEAGEAEQPDATQPEAAQEEECCIIRVTPSTDASAPLSMWLSSLGGKVVNVAANGHCGWLAFYAALFNVEEGLDSVSKEVAESANMLKKQVLNPMIANIMDEVTLHPQELQAELRASGCHKAAAGTYEEQ
ncbi:hypothetical protein PR002_g28248, partial [Phytophthora rubi]